MPTIGSITKTIRLNPKDLEVIEGLMKDGTTWSGAIHKLCVGVPVVQSVSQTGVPQNTPEPSKGVPSIDEKVLKDIEVMCSFFGIEVDEFFKELCESLNSGSIFIDDGKIKGETEIDVKGFMEVCHEVNKNPQEMIDKCAAMIRRSQF